MTTPLYTTAILRLAASIPHESRLPAPQATVERRTPVCGSRIVVDVDTDAQGRVVQLGQQVHACALGQASAALMGGHAIGRTPRELVAARDALSDWLAGRRDDPGDWPGLELFAAARPHAARHASILLAFDAAAEASSLASTSCELEATHAAPPTQSAVKAAA